MNFAYCILGLLKYIFHVFKVPNNSLILLYGCIILNLPLMFQSWAIQTHQMKDTGSFWSTEMLEEGQVASVSILTHKTLHKAPEMLFLLWQFCTECIPHFTSWSALEFTGSSHFTQASIDFLVWTASPNADTLGQECNIPIHFWTARPTTRKSDNGKLMEQLSPVKYSWDQEKKSTVITLLLQWWVLGNYCCKKKLYKTFQKMQMAYSHTSYHY